MIHELKTEPQYFEAEMVGIKRFEVRKNDRGYKVGDYLSLNEYDSETAAYTGRSLLFEVVYILDNEDYCKKGFVVMGLALSYYDKNRI